MEKFITVGSSWPEPAGLADATRWYHRTQATYAASVAVIVMFVITVVVATSINTTSVLLLLLATTSTKGQTLADLRNSKKINDKWNNNIFETLATFFIARIKAKWDKCGGRILLGDNTDGGEVMLLPMRFQRIEIWVSTGLPSETWSLTSSEERKLRVFENRVLRMMWA